MIIYYDVAQKKGKHETKHSWLVGHGVSVKPLPLPCGDYIIENERVRDVLMRKSKRGINVKKMDLIGTYDTVVDTKENIQEIINNVCGKSHGRFRDECILAKNNGVKLIILIENDNMVKSIDDLDHWDNPRARLQKWITTIAGERRKILKYPNATSGTTLKKALHTMEDKYGVQFLFCKPEDAGRRVLELLEV